MNMLTCVSEVVFRQRFFLNGLDGSQPPGTYRVETYSELLDTSSVVAYRRLSTAIELHSQPAGIIRTATIDPADLEEALRRDAATQSMLPLASMQEDDEVYLTQAQSTALTPLPAIQEQPKTD